MNLGLIITNDWEVFGDGSGDYFELQHKPLEALLKVVEEYGAKLTVMAEVGQQWAHQTLRNKSHGRVRSRHLGNLCLKTLCGGNLMFNCTCTLNG